MRLLSGTGAPGPALRKASGEWRLFLPAHGFTNLIVSGLLAAFTVASASSYVLSITHTPFTSHYQGQETQTQG